MTTLQALRDGLKARLDTIAGLRVYDTAPGQVEPPCAVIWVDQVVYATTMGGRSHEVILAVLLLVSAAVERVAQDALDGYMSFDGASSIYAAVEADPDLGGLVDACQVIAVPEGQAGLVEYGGVQYQGARFNVGVMVS